MTASPRDTSSAPWLTTTHAHDTLLRRFAERVMAMPNAAAIEVLAEGGAARDEAITWVEWAARAACVAGALIAAGFAPGDRVAIVAGNTPLWPIADVGALMAGGIVAGVFPTSTREQALEVLRDCDPAIVIVGDAAQRAKVIGASRENGAPRVIVGPDEWDAWLERGRRALEDATIAAELTRRATAARPNDVAGLIYTSGSTGEPKGACVSHEYLLASAESIADALGLRADDSSLSVLPYAHAAERIFGHYTRIVVGMRAGMVADAARMWAAARAFRPTVFGGMPRLYEKVHDALLTTWTAATGDERAAWDRLVSLGGERSRLRRAGQSVPETLQREWSSLRGRADVVLVAMLGDRLRLATSGGAPLDATIAATLDAVGLTVLGAYGQTEHLCVAFHRPDDYAFDSVGRAMRGTELRIADDDELLLRRGALTFSGYWHRPQATRDAFTDDGAWLRTGDLARLDAQGRLVITGRKKEILALSTGKKISPLPIEARLAEHPAVAQAVLFGDGRKHAAALLFLRDGAQDHDSLGTHVDAVNGGLAPHEQVRRWCSIPAELSERAGELTPTQKVKRNVVAARYADAVEALFT